VANKLASSQGLGGGGCLGGASPTSSRAALNSINPAGTRPGSSILPSSTSHVALLRPKSPLPPTQELHQANLSAPGLGKMPSPTVRGEQHTDQVLPGPAPLSASSPPARNEIVLPPDAALSSGSALRVDGQLPSEATAASRRPIAPIGRGHPEVGSPIPPTESQKEIAAPSPPVSCIAARSGAKDAEQSVRSEACDDDQQQTSGSFTKRRNFVRTPNGLAGKKVGTDGTVLDEAASRASGARGWKGLRARTAKAQTTPAFITKKEGNATPAMSEFLYTLRKAVSVAMDLPTMCTSSMGAFVLRSAASITKFDAASLSSGASEHEEMTEALIALLATLPAFATQPTDALRHICEAAQFRTMGRNEIVYREGSQANWCCVLLRGDMELSSHGVVGERLTRSEASQPLVMFGPGGGAVLPMIRFHTCTAAKDDCEVIILNKAQIPHPARAHIQLTLVSSLLMKVRLLAFQDNDLAMEAAPLFDIVVLEAGDVVTREGDPAEDMFVFLSGRIDVRVKGGEGSDVTVGSISSHDDGASVKGTKLVGEGALASSKGAKRNASMIAADPCYLMRISKSKFPALLALSPGLPQRCKEAQAMLTLSNMARKAADDQQNFGRLLNYLEKYNDTSIDHVMRSGARSGDG